MKSKTHIIYKVLSLVIFISIVFNCNDKTKDSDKPITNNKSKTPSLKPESLLEMKEDTLFFNVILSKEYNNKFQLVHMEGKYEMPFFILAKFTSVKTGQDTRKITEIEYKIHRNNNLFYKLREIPKTDQESEDLIKSKIIVQSLERRPSEDNKKNSGINFEVKSGCVFDPKVKLDDSLIELFSQEFDLNTLDHYTILCCSGAICKAKLIVDNVDNVDNG